MKDKIARIKEIAHRRRTAIVFSTGVAVGAVPVLYVLSKYLTSEVYVTLTPESLALLTDDPSRNVSFPLDFGMLHVLSTDHPQLKQ